MSNFIDNGKNLPYNKLLGEVPPLLEELPEINLRSEVIIMQKLIKLLLLPRCSLGQRALASSGFAEL